MIADQLNKNILIIIAITIAAFALRYAYINNSTIPNPFIADAKQYVIYGYNLANHHVYSMEAPDASKKRPIPDSFRSPGFPGLLALSFLLGGNEGFYPVILIIHTLISSLMVILSYYLARLIMPYKYALTVAVLTALSPHLITMSGYMLTETLFSFLLLSAITAWAYALKNQKVWWYFGSALFFGLTYLTNETALFVPLLFGVYSTLSSTKKKISAPGKKLYTNLFVFTLVFLLFPLSWNIRNSNLPEGTTTGNKRALTTIGAGSYPDFIYKTEKYKYYPYREDPSFNEYVKSPASLGKNLLDRFKNEPGKYLSWYLIKKPFLLWSWNILQGQGDVYVYYISDSWYDKSTTAGFLKQFMWFIHPAILLLAFISLPLTIIQSTYKGGYKDHVLMLSIMTCIYYTVLYSIFASYPRYSVPLRPELYIVAVWTIFQVELYLKNKLNPSKTIDHE